MDSDSHCMVINGPIIYSYIWWRRRLHVTFWNVWEEKMSRHDFGKYISSKTQLSNIKWVNWWEFHETIIRLIINVLINFSNSSLFILKFPLATMLFNSINDAAFVMHTYVNVWYAMISIKFAVRYENIHSSLEFGRNTTEMSSAWNNMMEIHRSAKKFLWKLPA